MINYYDNLNLGGTSELLSGARVHIRPSSDKVSLSAHAFSGAQTSPIVEVKTSTGSDIFKISNAMIDLYSDLRANTGSNLVMSSHNTRIVSGHYIAPLINSAVLSGSLNANSTRITSLAQATAMSDAVTLNQANAAISGSLMFNGAYAPVGEVGDPSTVELEIYSKSVVVRSGDQIELEVFGTIKNDTGVGRTYTYAATLGTFTVSLTDNIATSASASDLAPVNLRAIFSVASTSSIGCIFRSEKSDIAATNTATLVTEVLQAYDTSGTNQVGTKTVKMSIYSDVDDTKQTFYLHSATVRRLPTLL